jgi:serine/threonine protein kinase
MHKQGGLGAIYVAHDSRTQREVAFKKLHSETLENPYARHLFRAEALVTAQLQHPSIISVYDIGEYDEGKPYYTMPFVEGRTLCEYIDLLTKNRSTSKLSNVDLLRLLGVFRSVCHAVSYAHSKGVVHLDIKPSNVILGEYGEVILVDWGCAQHTHMQNEAADSDPERSTDTDSTKILDPDPIVATPAYMAPEQGAGDELGTATDIYQLGAMLYEILTGGPPHGRDSFSKLVRKALEDRAGQPWSKPAREVNRRAPPALSAICDRAMAKDPAKRYPTVDALSRDVEHWMADEPVSVYRSGVVSSSVRMIRRHQTLAPILIVTVCLLCFFYVQLLALGLQQRCDQIGYALIRDIGTSVSSVDAMRNFFETRRHVSRQEFRLLAVPFLERHAEVSALEWIPAVSRGEREDYEKAARKEAWPTKELSSDFSFTQLTEDSRLEKSPARDVYYPVFYLEPYSGNETAYGYDVGSSQDRMRSLNLARMSGKTTITRPIKLIQDAPGFLAIAPVSQDLDESVTDRMRGFVLGVFRVERAIASALHSIENDQLSVQVYDVTDPADVSLLWKNSPSADPDVNIGFLSATRRLSLWNRKWLVVAKPKLGFALTNPFSRMKSTDELGQAGDYADPFNSAQHRLR